MKTFKVIGITVLVSAICFGGICGTVFGLSAFDKHSALVKVRKQEEQRSAVEMAEKNKQMEIERAAEQAQETSRLNDRFYIEKDDVRGLTHYMPNNEKGLRTGVYGYVADKGDGSPTLFLRCMWVGDDLKHFDQVKFRVNSKTYTIENENFQLIHHGIDTPHGLYGEHIHWMYYDFQVIRGDNRSAFLALLTASNGTKFRFYSTTYGEYEDIVLSADDIQWLKDAQTLMGRLKR